jgi:hypothetical protein
MKLKASQNELDALVSDMDALVSPNGSVTWILEPPTEYTLTSLAVNTPYHLGRNADEEPSRFFVRLTANFSLGPSISPIKPVSYYSEPAYKTTNTPQRIDTRRCRR